MKECNVGNQMNRYIFCAVCNLVDGKPQFQDEIGPDGEYDLCVFTHRETNILSLRIWTSGMNRVFYDVDCEDD